MKNTRKNNVMTPNEVAEAATKREAKEFMRLLRDKVGHKTPGPKTDGSALSLTKDVTIEILLKEFTAAQAAAIFAAYHHSGSFDRRKAKKLEMKRLADGEDPIRVGLTQRQNKNFPIVDVANAAERSDPLIPEYDPDAVKPPDFSVKPSRSLIKTIERIRDRMIKDGQLTNTKRPWGRDR